MMYSEKYFAINTFGKLEQEIIKKCENYAINEARNSLEIGNKMQICKLVNVRQN